MKSILVGLGDVSGSHGGEYEGDSIMGYCTMKIPEGCHHQVGPDDDY
jgi:hypothetical protein